jgi:hypothetical protein
MQPQSLAALLAEHPEIRWVPSKESAVTVARSVHVRWRLQRELSDAGVGAGYVRSEGLAAIGVSANDLDSREFAKGLVAALADHLTPRNLKDLAEAFAEAYSAEAAARATAAASKVPEVHQTAAPAMAHSG